MADMAEPRIRSVRAASSPATLDVVWANGRRSRVSFAGPIARLKAFRPLEDPTLFRSVRAIERGWAIGWTDEIEYSADALWRLAEAQRAMTAAEFRAWQARLGLSNVDAAAVLGRTPRMIVNYRTGDMPVPAAVKLACAAIENDRTLLYAHLPLRGRAAA
jgi:hypothetical protein